VPTTNIASIAELSEGTEWLMERTFVLKNSNIGSSILNKSLRIKREHQNKEIPKQLQRLGFRQHLP